MAQTRSKVAVLKTNPNAVVQDYGRLMDMAGYSAALPKSAETCLRINISWHVYYPACSTTPWQLDGVVGKMVSDGWDPKRLIAAQNKTVVVDCRSGAINNKLQLKGYTAFWYNIPWAIRGFGPKMA